MFELDKDNIIYIYTHHKYMITPFQTDNALTCYNPLFFPTVHVNFIVLLA